MSLIAFLGLFWKALVSAVVIIVSVILAKKHPDSAGFIVAMPITTMLALIMTQVEYSDPGKSVLLAKSVFAAIPLSLLFFIPFLFADKLKLGFWQAYLSGTAFILIGYFIHKYAFKYFFS